MQNTVVLLSVICTGGYFFCQWLRVSG